MSKTVIITGGASGIGRAIAESFAREYYYVVIADLNEPEKLYDNMHFIKTDLSKQEDCKQLVFETLEKFFTVDILINNAGFQHVAPIEDFPEDKWDLMIKVMLTAPFLLTKYVWPGMQKQMWGRIVNMGSIHSLVASLHKPGYITCKHGLIGLTKTTALEGGAYNITANAICPAYVRTPLVEGQIAAQAETLNIPEEEVIEKVLLKSTVSKKLIEPEEVADMVLFLCSDKGKSVTGAAWTIDGGWTAQ